MSRPSIFLDDFVQRVWQNETLFSQECHSDLKVYYILFQILNEVKTQVIEKDLVNNCLRLRSFHIDKLTWEIKLTNYAFAEHRQMHS